VVEKELIASEDAEDIAVAAVVEEAPGNKGKHSRV
jgi:hypothetical protein